MSQKLLKESKKHQKHLILQDEFKRIGCNLDEPPQPKHWVSAQEKDEFVLGQLCKQIEFYLSDTNLRSDYFFRELVEASQDVPLVTFLKCNRVRKYLAYYPSAQQGQQLALLEEALKGSRLLKVRKGDCVRRKTKFQLDEKTEQELDERTVYVQCLPKNIDNEMLFKIFRNVGLVTEAKVSKYRDSKVSKGFGFVTFAHTSSAVDAVLRYNNCMPKEIQALGIYTSALQVIPKSQWKTMKDEAKQLLHELKQQTTNVEKKEPIQMRLVGLKLNPSPEEIRAALGHAVYIHSIKLVKLVNDYAVVYLNDGETKELLLSNIDRVRNYSTKFSYCEAIED